MLGSRQRHADFMCVSRFIGLGALFHGSPAATLLRGVEPILFEDKSLLSQSVLIMSIFSIQ